MREFLLDAEKRAEYDARLNAQAQAERQAQLEAKMQTQMEFAPQNMSSEEIRAWQSLADKRWNKTVREFILFSSLLIFFVMLFWNLAKPVKVVYQKHLEFSKENGDVIKLDYKDKVKSSAGASRAKCSSYECKETIPYTQYTPFYINDLLFHCSCHAAVCRRKPSDYTGHIFLERLSIVQINDNRYCLVLSLKYQGQIQTGNVEKIADKAIYSIHGKNRDIWLGLLGIPIVLFPCLFFVRNRFIYRQS